MKPMDLRGKIAFIAGVADDAGFGFAIAKALYECGAKILVGTWPPMLKIFEQSWAMGKFDSSRKCSDGRRFDIEKVYPLDATFDTKESVPEEIRQNKRYAGLDGYTIQEVAEAVHKDYGHIDILIHSIANAPEVKNPLLKTSRQGYLAALSSSSYSFISLVSHFGPYFSEAGSVLTLSYAASTKAIPGYGGGMSSAKAALESDVRTLAYEAGKKWNLRINAISAGPLRSRAAKAIGMIDHMISYSKANSPLPHELYAEQVANAAAFLSSDLASAITGSTIFVDHGLNIMGLAMDSKSLENYSVEA